MSEPGGQQGERAVRGTGRSSLARGGILLAVGSVLANVLGYALTIVLTRSYGPAEYGALGALLGAALIAGIPAGGLQYVLARRTAAGHLPAGRNDRTGLVLSGWLGGGLTAIVLAVSGVAAGFLHLGTVWPVVWLAAMMVPYTVGGAMQGALLGHERYAAFSMAQVLAGVCRFGAAVVTAALGLSVSGAMAALAAGMVLSSAGTWLLTGPASWRGRGSRPAELVPDLVRSCSAIAGIIVLSNVDLLLARHFLSREDSGAYALASLFAKACLWGAQFVPLLVFPRLSRGDGGRGLVLRAAAAAAGVGAAGIVVTAVAAGPIVRMVAGQEGGYPGTVALAVPFAVLGTGWALVQLALFVAVAAADPRPGRLLWGVVAVEAGVIALWLHDTPHRILAACLGATVALLAGAVLLDLLPSRRRAATGPPPTATPEAVPSRPA